MESAPGYKVRERKRIACAQHTHYQYYTAHYTQAYNSSSTPISATAALPQGVDYQLGGIALPECSLSRRPPELDEVTKTKEEEGLTLGRGRPSVRPRPSGERYHRDKKKCLKVKGSGRRRGKDREGRKEGRKGGTHPSIVPFCALSQDEGDNRNCITTETIEQRNCVGCNLQAIKICYRYTEEI